MLTRIIIGRSDIDLEEIKREYLELYDKTLAKAIDEHSSSFVGCFAELNKGFTDAPNALYIWQVENIGALFCL